MPFFKLKKSRRYNVVSKNAYVACVHLLDGAVMECTLTSESTAKECLNSVIQRMELTETAIFSLKFVNKHDQFQWVELDKPLKKQIDKNARDSLLHFSVTFYIPEPHKVTDEMSRYQLFLQLKSDILDGRLLCSPEQAVRLAAYSLQVEFGDHIFEQHTPEYFSECALLPRNMMTDEQHSSRLLQEVLGLHQNFRGMAPTLAEIQYIREAEQLDGYGYEYYNAKDESGNNVILGTSYDGLFIKSINEQTGVFLKWRDIKSLGTNKKSLVVKTTLKEQPFNIIMDDPEMAKYAWRQFVAQRKFSLNIPMDVSDHSPPDGSTGAIPDIQQSVQAQIEDSESVTHAAHYQAELVQTMPAADNFYLQPPVNEETPSVAHLHDGSNNIGSMYSVSQSEISHSASGSYEERMAALPAYRPSPDYHEIMQQRLAQQQAVAHQPSLPAPPVAAQRGMLPPTHMLTSSQHQQNKSGDGEPLYANLDQYLHRGRNPDNGSFAGGESAYANLSTYTPSQVMDSYPAQGAGEPCAPTRPVDRSSSLIIHPTFDKPEVPPRNLCTSHYNSENKISDVLLNDYKPPPPYTRGSSSTPDLASQTVQHNKQRSDSPDLISRRNIAPSNLSQGLYRSVENLASDCVHLSVDHDVNIEDDLSSEKSDATFHAKGSDDEEAETTSESNLEHGEVNPNSVEAQMIRNYLASGVGYTNAPSSVYFSSQSVNTELPPGITSQAWQDSQPLMDSRDRSFSDTHVSYTGTSTTVTPSMSSIQQTIVVPPAVEMTASQESVRSVVQMTASQESVRSAVYHSELPSPGAVDSVVNEAGSVEEAGCTHNKEPEAIIVPAMVVPDDVHVKTANECSTNVGTKSEGGVEADEREQPTQQSLDSNSVKEATRESAETSDEGGHQLTQQSLDSSPVKHVTQDSAETSSQVRSDSVKNSTEESTSQAEAEASLKEQVAAVKLRKAGPLKMAAMNGLVVSRTSIMLQQNDESRAPKDDRRGILETKVEEGQVFHEYQQIPRKPAQCDCTTGALPENESKNRFKDVLPYEENRVQLKPKKKNKLGYINASHMKVEIGSNEYWYVATQAPLENTIADFWQMVWEQRTMVIAMMMELDSAGKTKCATYWPQKAGTKHKLTFGDFQVVLQFTNSSMCYVTNTLILVHKPSRQERTIWHLQYTDWPEHGCPEDVYGFLSFLDEIESVQRHDDFDDGLKRPVIVHCSAGVGRTGVVILCEIMKNCLEYNQPVDIPAMLTKLRSQRMHMIQTVGQYSFVYNSLITYLKNSRLI